VKIFKKTRTGRTLHYFFTVLTKRKLPILINFTFTPIAIFFGETLVGYKAGILFEKLVEYKAGGSTADLYSLGWTIVIFYIIQIVFYRINDYTAILRQVAGLRDLEQYIFSRLPLHSYGFFSETYGGGAGQSG
jgi:hypothetical protein